MTDGMANMKQAEQVIKQLIDISDKEMADFLSQTTTRTFKKNEILSAPGVIPNEIYLVLSGIVRVFITDTLGNEHTLYFAQENLFITDYACYLQQQPSNYHLQALAPTEVVIFPRETIEWGYKHLAEGQKMGRLIAEFYFIYQDKRILQQYAMPPKMRYDAITNVFPNIHNLVPQHMIASYLGITSVHLSRLKKQSKKEKI